jgi:predicted dehydrogenase
MNIFVIGFGSIGKRHIRNLKNINSNINIFVVRNKKPNKDNNFDDCNLNLINNFFYSYDDAINSKILVDIIFICNPAPFHMNTIKQFSKLKPKAFYIEKPLSNNIITNEEKNYLLELSINTIIYNGYMTRYSESLNYFKNLIDKNFIGKIFYVESKWESYLPFWRKSHDYRKDVTGNKNMGGDIALELSHELDYLNYLFGEVENLYSLKNKFSDLEINTDDFLINLIKFKDKNFIVNLQLNFFNPNENRYCKMIGEKGILNWNGIDNCINFYPRKKNTIPELLFQSKEVKNSMYINKLNKLLSDIENSNYQKNEVVNMIKIVNLILETKNNKFPN